MNHIRTVCGDVHPTEIRKVLMHEHIVLGYAGWFYDPTIAPFDHSEAMDAALSRMEDLKERGVNLIVDPTPIELGRDAEFVQDVSSRSGMHIVCSTGFDLEARGGLSAIRHCTPDDILEIYMKEIEEGIGAAHVKPGIIKLATGYDAISEYEEACLRAAAIASRRTGLPIVTHTERGTMGPQQARMLKRYGADPGKCLIGHCCANSDLRYQREILEEGVYIGFDRFGNSWHGDDWLRLHTLTALLHMGYADHIFLSTDSVAYWMGRKIKGRDTRHWDPVYLFDEIIPALYQRGIGEDMILAMTEENAKCFWA